MEVVQFASADEVDPILFGRSYFVEPERVAVPSYAVLREVLTRSSRVAVVRMGLRRREVLGVLRPRGGVLVLHTLLWPDEVREPDFGSVDVAVGAGAAEVRLAESLVDSMTAPFDVSVFSDGYQEALAALIEARAAGDGIPVSRAPDETGGAHLLDALRRSLDRVRSGRIRREE